jgi:hypothetical protein
VLIDTSNPVFTLEEIDWLVSQGHISLEFGASLNALFYNRGGHIVSTQPCGLAKSGELVPIEEYRETTYGWSSTVSTKEVIRFKTLLSQR